MVKSWQPSRGGKRIPRYLDLLPKSSLAKPDALISFYQAGSHLLSSYFRGELSVTEYSRTKCPPSLMT